MENPVQKFLDTHPDIKGWKLAKLSGLALASVYKILQGKTRCIQAVTIDKLVKGSKGKITRTSLEAWNRELAKEDQG